MNLPENGHEVTISDSDTASFNLASSLALIRPQKTDSYTGRVVFVVSGTKQFNAPITYTVSDATWVRPEVVKRGSGSLELVGDSSKSYSYYSTLYAEEGTLKLSQTTTKNQLLFGLVVSNGATFVTAKEAYTSSDYVYIDGTLKC